MTTALAVVVTLALTDVAPNPASGINTATAIWFEGTLKHESGTASFDFAAVSPNTIDETINVTDSFAGILGTMSVGDANPTTFTYDRPVTGTAGTCTTYDNTASFVTNDTGATDSSSATVKLCVGADLTVDKTAAPAFTRTYNWDITKSVDKTLVRQASGTTTFNYTVRAFQTGLTDSAWAVKGAITVSNPNDWQSVDVTDVSDALPGATCSLDGGFSAFTLTKQGTADASKTLNYTCAYAAQRVYNSSLTNTATATWDKNAAHTPSDSANGTAGFTFTTPTTKVDNQIAVSDTFNGGAPGALGMLTASDTAPFATAEYPYSRAIAITRNQCVRYDNTATLTTNTTGTTDTASQTVTVCSTQQGGLTIGYWQNNNGQGQISKAGVATGSTPICKLTPYLRQYAPFQDLSATAPCGSAVASTSNNTIVTSSVTAYAYTVVKAANASGAAMNAMLKAQMLATALSAYYDPTLAAAKIDLTKICKVSTSTCTINASGAFGGASSLTVAQMLSYAASQSTVGGSSWYSQVKTTQELAKDAFDSINNNKATIAQ